MLTDGCALGQALVDVLAELEAEGAALTQDEKIATVQLMEDILFNHMQDASDFAAPQDEVRQPRRRAATTTGLHVASSVENYSSYLETWRLDMTDTVIKVGGKLLNPTSPNVDATFRRMQRRRKSKKTKRTADDE